MALISCRDGHLITRRQALRSAGGLAVALSSPLAAIRLVAGALPQAATVDAFIARRAQLGATPIASAKLTDRLTLLSGPGGNVLVYTGSDGKLVVDTFVQPAWPGLKRVVDGLSAMPVTTVVNTHWHFDHTDNNVNFHQAGASIVAHDKTKARMSETHDLLGMHLLPSPAAALPTRTFATRDTIPLAGETVELTAITPAHTDTDIAVHFTSSDVLHLGDVFFNGMYPFFDAGTGGSINGMIDASSLYLKQIGDRTRVVPGHGTLGDQRSLMVYRDMLVTVRDRVQKLKTAGRTAAQVIAAKPTADFDAAWAGGLLTADDFTGIVYASLSA